MFGIYFGKFLQDKGIISSEQYDEIIEEQKHARVKLGLLAVESGMMTTAQAEEVNLLQTKLDQRFGDIAVEKGYLSGGQVESLLKKQGDAYLLFVQSLTEHGYLTLEQIQHELMLYKKEEKLTAFDLDAIKSSDIDNIVPVFTKEPSLSPVLKDYLALAARNMIRFISNQIRLEKVVKISEYTGNFMSSQAMEGQYTLFTGFASEGAGILELGSIYGREEFSQVDEDVLDAACEFLNCNNGLFASKLSQEDIELELMPPNMYTKKVTIHTEGNMYKMPIYISGKQLDLVICIESKLVIE